MNPTPEPNDVARAIGISDNFVQQTLGQNLTSGLCLRAWLLCLKWSSEYRDPKLIAQ